MHPKPNTAFVSSPHDMAEWAAIAVEHTRDSVSRYGSSVKLSEGEGYLESKAVEPLGIPDLLHAAVTPCQIAKERERSYR
jgi:hypothetical protein